MPKIMVKSGLLLLVSLISIQSLAEVLWIDVRSEIEFRADHITGDLNIPLKDIKHQISQYATSEMTTINLYCQSGGRAEQARSELAMMGYKDVSNHGGIEDVRVLIDMLQP